MKDQKKKGNFKDNIKKSNIHILENPEEEERENKE